MPSPEQIEERIKDFLKKINLSEETISTILGALVVLIVGSLIFNYFKEIKNVEQITDEAAQTVNLELEKLATPSAVQPDTYTVKEGDRLFQIAETVYGESKYWEQIATENNLPGPDYIAVGQVLKLPKIQDAQPQPGEVMSADSIESIKGETYSVKEGDSLESISLRAYGRKEDWTKIADANGLWNADYLQAEMTLKIPR